MKAKIGLTLAALALIVGGIITFRQLWRQEPVTPFENIPAAITAQTVYSLPASKPKQIKISSIKVDAPVINVDLNKDNSLEVPKTYSDVGWYDRSPTPGEVGPAVMVGHLDSAISAAVFYKLKDIKANDHIEITREDGSKAIFKVDSLEVFSQDSFPSDKVYGNVNYPGLRLITCAGKYNILEKHYSQNLVVYASLVKTN
ncbi:MAG: peptidase sortase [Candidatus Doudnabacteria bacterium]|nr:peptidase sortase [Candidatus Doudnabacteria bacterium]